MEKSRKRGKSKKSMKKNSKLENFSLPLSQESISLAKKAWMELAQNKSITVVCPKCKSIVRLVTPPNSNREYLYCDCGYVASGIIKL